MTALPTSVIVDWLEGRLPEEEADLVAATIECAFRGADPVLAERVAWVRQFLRLARSARVEDPPPDVHDVVVAMFDGSLNAPAPASEPRTARLVFDSREHLAGVRSRGGTTAWSQVFSGVDIDVAVDVNVTGDTAMIDGQVLTERDPARTEVWARLADVGPATSAELDELGQFTVGPVPLAPLWLDVVVDDHTLRIPLELRSP